MLKNILFLAAMIFIFVSCGSKDKNGSGKDLQNVNFGELMNLKGSERLYAVIQTDMGVIEVQLLKNEAPKTVRNFVGLALQNFYNGLIFHRVIKDYMIQGGDPTGTGKGGATIYGEPFEDEFSITLKHESPGILSMANSGPNTNKSQFFITVAPTPWLDFKHTIFGKVVKGIEVVNSISLVPTDKLDRPIKDVFIEKITIEKRAN